MKKIFALFIYVISIGITYSALSFWTAYHKPCFSIITSVYNYDKYVAHTIESVLASDYPYFELILVNDGSTDHSLDVIKRYALKDKRIKVIDQENQGLSIARNNAMKIAKGDYFWFVDADDYISPKALSSLAKQIKKTNYPDLISFYIQTVDENEQNLPVNGYWKLPTELEGYRDFVFIGNSLPLNVIAAYSVTSGKQIYSKKFLQKHNIKFVPKLVFEDDCFFLTTLEAGARGTIIPDFLYYKRAHGKSIVANKPLYYDSTALLPIKIYEAVKRVGAPEERARMYWQLYFGGIFGKFPGRKKDLIPLEKLLNYISDQPQDEFWQTQNKNLLEFYEEKKNSPLREEE